MDFNHIFMDCLYVFIGPKDESFEDIPNTYMDFSHTFTKIGLTHLHYMYPFHIYLDFTQSFTCIYFAHLHGFLVCIFRL